MAFRDIPRDIKDEKDVESFFRALRDKAVSITSHSELKDIKEVDKSSTDTSRNKHVSDYDMKKVEDHMDDASKHLNQELTGGSNYLSSVTGTSPISVTGSGTSRNVALVAFSHTNGSVITDVGTKTHDQIDTHINSTSNPHSTSDANLVTTDVTTNNVSTSKHGFAPKAPNDATKYLDGVGNYSVPPTGTTYTGGKNIVISGSDINLAMESGCAVYRGSTQSIGSGSTTVIQYTTENFDSGNEYDTSTYKFTSATGGKYLITVSVGLTAVTTNKLVEVNIHKNGGSVAQCGTRAADSGGGSADVRVQATKVINLSAGDYIEGAVYHEHGSARDTIAQESTTYMSIAFIG